MEGLTHGKPWAPAPQGRGDLAEGSNSLDLRDGGEGELTPSLALRPGGATHVSCYQKRTRWQVEVETKVVDIPSHSSPRYSGFSNIK